MSSSYDPSVPDLDEVAREIAEGQAITDQLTESQACLLYTSPSPRDS